MRLFLFLLSVTALSGCTTFQRQAAVNPLTAIEAKAEYCSTLGKKYPSGDLKKIIAPLCDGNTNGVASGNNRDYLINLMMVSDRVCARELASLSANQRTVNAAFSTTSTALSATATIVTGGLADNILTGGATLFGSTRDHINAEVFRAAQPEIVTLLIQADRQAIANDLLVDNKGRNFSRQEAIYFSNQYHQACSFFHGLALLSEAANERADAIKKQQNYLSSLTNPTETETETETEPMPGTPTEVEPPTS